MKRPGLPTGARSARIEQGGSADVSDMTDAREEIEQRLNFLLPQAERMLNERGDFYPYAAALDRAGTIDAVAAPWTSTCLTGAARAG
jgi:hypothetical protein